MKQRVMHIRKEMTMTVPKFTRHAIAPLAAFLTLPFGGIATAQCCEASEFAQVLASDGGALYTFGNAIAVYGDAFVVGSQFHTHGGVDTCGGAYVFRYGSSWTEEDELLATDREAGDQMGISVGINGTAAIAGAASEDETASNAGAAYIFRFNGTDRPPEAKLRASDGAASDGFGFSVAMSGNVAVVGAPFDNVSFTDDGSVYVFRFSSSTWSQEQKLVGSGSANNRFFGTRVAIDGNVIVASSTFNGAVIGKVDVFRYNGSTWASDGQLVATGVVGSDLYGTSVSVSGNVAIVGAPNDDDAGTNAGAVYVFRYNGSSWVEEVKLTSCDPNASALYGTSVSVSGDQIVVGSPGTSVNGASSGAAFSYRYDSSTWNPVAELFPSDGANSDEFGRSVSIDRGYAAVGAPNNTIGIQTNRGAAYAFNGFPQCECVADLNDDCEVNSLDLGILLSSWTLPPATSCSGSACDADINGDGVVNTLDLGILLAAWGSCPGCESFQGGGGDFELDAELIGWLLTTSYDDLWAWWVELFGGE